MSRIDTKLWSLVFIFILAASVRFLYIDQIKDVELFTKPMVDSGDYHTAGIDIAKGLVTGSTVTKRLLRTSFYHSFLGNIYSLSAPGTYFAAIVQAILNSIICCLICFLGRNIFDNRVGIVSGIFAALYWPFIAFCGKTLPVNLAVFFAFSAVVTLYMFCMSKKNVWIYVTGVLFALGAFARPNLLLFLPVVCIWIFFGSAYNTKRMRRLIAVLVFVLGAASVMVPNIVQDYRARGELVPIQKNYMVTFYAGTSVDNVNLKPGVVWKKKMYELLNLGLLAQKDRDAYWAQEIRKKITQEPTKYFNDFAEKIYIWVNDYEFTPHECINYLRASSKFLSMPLPGFGILFAFGVPGMLLAYKKRRDETRILFLFMAVYVCSVIPFLPLARYRLPVVPVLAIFAAYFGVVSFDRLRKKEWKRLLHSAKIFLPVCLLVNTNIIADRVTSFNRAYYHDGNALFFYDKLPEALLKLHIAQEKHPYDPDIYKAKGDVYMARGNMDEAEKNYKYALSLEYEFLEAREQLGVLYAKRGETDRAIEVLEDVLVSFPVQYDTTYINLAGCFVEKGDYEQAATYLEKALEVQPHNIKALYRLTVVYEKLEDPRAEALRAKWPAWLREASKSY